MKNRTFLKKKKEYEWLSAKFYEQEKNVFSILTHYASCF